MSKAKVSVLNEILQDPTAPHWGYDLMRRTNLGSGSLYPILSQLEAAGWIEGTWELDKNAVGGPPRKAYRITGEGLRAAPAALVAFRSRKRLRPQQTPSPEGVS
jgi:PadR family transcriptional regulator PadR